jgi:hypothetical protein
MKNAQLNKLRKRDFYCWHCGSTDTLVPHHRANRGMGSFKALDTLQNIILVCADFNGRMESDAAVATWARDLGLKLSKFANPSEPVFDNYAKLWFTLDEQGNKTETEPPSYLI